AYVGEPADRLRPAERPDLVYAEQLRGGGDQACAGGRRADDELLDTGSLRRHRAHDERRDEVARDVDPDRLERHPPPLERYAGLDLEGDVRRPLRLVPAA